MNQKHFSSGDPGTPTIIIQQPGRRLLVLGLLFVLAFSMMMNFGLLLSLAQFSPSVDAPTEKFHAGNQLAKDKIARIDASFMISSPFTDRIIKVIDHVREQEDIKGVLLVVDSPGGLVSDSHQIYDKLTRLAEKKPIFVQMKGIAASGGYYIAMGAGPEGKIFAEPTTWTGSIGVMVPRYNASELAEKVGVKSEPLVTGPLKQTLSPFKNLSDEEKAVWEIILEDSFDRFLTVIDGGRPKLTKEKIREIATGQIYTSQQALELGLVDEISFEEDTLLQLQEHLGLKEARIVKFETPKTFAESLLGVRAAPPEVHLDPFHRILEASTPRAMYLFGWEQALNH